MIKKLNEKMDNLLEYDRNFSYRTAVRSGTLDKVPAKCSKCGSVFDYPSKMEFNTAKKKGKHVCSKCKD